MSRFVRRRPLLLAAMSALATAGSLAGIHRKTPDKRADQFAEAAQPGDVVFRRTHSLEGWAVQWVDGASPYTHVGIVSAASGGGQPMVVHANPGNVPGDPGGVVAHTWAEFANPSSVTALALGSWRLGKHQHQQALGDLARAQVGKPFDAGFDFNEHSALYCTELVWTCAAQLGWVRSPTLRQLSTPFGPIQVLTISDLSRQLPIELHQTWAIEISAS